MSFNTVLNTSLVSLLALAAATAQSAHAAVEPELVRSLAQSLFNCVEQPYGINSKTGNLIYGALRSHCAGVEISKDRAALRLKGRSFTVLVKDSELSDGGDLSDLYIQYDSREDQEVQVATNLLSFGDPALSILLLTGHRPEEIPQVADPSLNLTL